MQTLKRQLQTNEEWVNSHAASHTNLWVQRHLPDFDLVAFCHRVLCYRLGKDMLGCGLDLPAITKYAEEHGQLAMLKEAVEIYLQYRHEIIARIMTRKEVYELVLNAIECI